MVTELPTLFDGFYLAPGPDVDCPRYAEEHGAHTFFLGRRSPRSCPGRRLFVPEPWPGPWPGRNDGGDLT